MREQKDAWEKAGQYNPNMLTIMNTSMQMNTSLCLKSDAIQVFIGLVITIVITIVHTQLITQLAPTQLNITSNKCHNIFQDMIYLDQHNIHPIEIYQLVIMNREIQDYCQNLGDHCHHKAILIKIQIILEIHLSLEYNFIHNMRKHTIIIFMTIIEKIYIYVFIYLYFRNFIFYF